MRVAPSSDETGDPQRLVRREGPSWPLFSDSCARVTRPLPGPVSRPLPHREMKRVGTINGHPGKNVHF